MQLNQSVMVSAWLSLAQAPEPCRVGAASRSPDRSGSDFHRDSHGVDLDDIVEEHLHTVTLPQHIVTEVRLEIVRCPVRTMLLKMFDTYLGLRSTRVTATVSSHRRRYLATVAPAMPPPITITRALGLAARGSPQPGSGSVTSAAYAEAKRKARRVESRRALSRPVTLRTVRRQQTPMRADPALRHCGVARAKNRGDHQRNVSPCCEGIRPSIWPRVEAR